MSHLKQLWVVLVGTLLLAGTALAQVDRGTITGIVTDSSGAVVPGVTITVTNVGTGIATRVVTNATGTYSVPLLPAAVYRLTAEREGFKKYTQTNITVSVGSTISRGCCLNRWRRHGECYGDV